VFVPIAFAWPVLRRIGVETFPTTYRVGTRDEKKIELPLADEPYFAIAHEIAKQAMADGASGDMSLAQYQAVVRRSGEWQAVSAALAQNISIKGGTLGSPLILRLTADEALKHQ